MKSLRSLTLTCSTLLIGLSGTMAQEQSLSWNWANVICGDMLNCVTGCSACNQPSTFADNFYGTGAAWIGLNTCPHPTVTGDNSVYSDGWAPAPDPLKVVMLSGMVTGPMALDSIVIRHKSVNQGPTWLRVSLKRNLTEDATMVYEGPIPTDFNNLVLTDMGCMEIPQGASSGGFQLQFQAYGSDAGEWVLDAVRVVAAPCEPDFSTGITTVSGKPAGQPAPMFDVLGRPAGPGTVLGISRDGKRRVVIE
ncbi:MAG: hypothetical protein LKM36_03350 [Flavobacteriales bacterium]|jgi:hypothetical protein|nr:hypothetical protein [Flavobacteriales bacterium]